MFKKIVLALCILGFFSLAGAETVFERSFADMGYASLIVDSPNSTGCVSMDFVFPSDKNVFLKENYPIVSLNAEFMPKASEAAIVSAKINGFELKEIKATDFKCGEECVYRLWLPKDLLLKAANTLVVCAETSNTTAKIVLKNNSKTGIYKTANFFAKEAFTTVSEKSGLVIGDKTKITVSLHNAGSAPAEVELKYARPIAEEKDAFAVIEGNAYGQGLLMPGEAMKIEYIIKPRVLGSITLPPAAAYYTNEFGEQETIFSTLATIKIREPEKKLEAFIGKEKEINRLGETAKMNLSIKNSGKDTVYDLEVSLEAPEEITTLGEKTVKLDYIAPGETRTIAFQANSSSAGTFDIGCKINYLDLNLEETKCENTMLIFEEPGISTTLIAAIVLVLIGAGVYVYLMKSK